MNESYKSKECDPNPQGQIHKDTCHVKVMNSSFQSTKHYSMANASPNVKDFHSTQTFAIDNIHNQSVGRLNPCVGSTLTQS